jgi:hypothetical protein
LRRQARIGAFNRRVAAHIENDNRSLSLDRGALGPRQVAELFCTCGREDCDEVLTLSLDEYAFVREQPYRFLVAAGHADDVDEVVRSTGEYDVVEVKPEYREEAAALLARTLDEIGRGGRDLPA